MAETPYSVYPEMLGVVTENVEARQQQDYGRRVTEARMEAERAIAQAREAAQQQLTQRQQALAAEKAELSRQVQLAQAAAHQTVMAERERVLAPNIQARASAQAAAGQHTRERVARFNLNRPLPLPGA